MIKIYDGDVKSFINNGKIAIRPVEIKEYKKKSLNGWYIEVEVSIKYAKYIVKDDLCVIKSKSKLNPQAFRIGDPTKNSKTIRFTAYHVMFDSQNYMLDDVRPINKNALNALEYINNRTNKKSPFSYSSNITKLATAYFQLKSLYEAWVIIEERWGGCFDADNWNIILSDNLGKNVGEMLVYQKNLEDLSIVEDWSDVVTELYPVGPDGLKLPEKCIESDIKYKIPYSKTVEFTSDLDNYDEDGNEIEIPQEDLISELREKATEYLNNNKYPKVSYEITTNISENYDINDKIMVKHPLVNLQTEVQEYVYDHKLKKTESLVFGNYKKDIIQKISSFKESVSQINDQLLKNNDTLKKQKDIINTLNKLGHVYIDDNEILILDALPKEEAKYVLRLGLGGIAFSDNGYEGDFKTAWTIDGNFNADFINSGKINTNLIEGYTELIMKVDTMTDLTRNITATGYLELTNAFEGDLLNFSISGQMSLLYPADDLYPANDLYLLDSYLIIQNSSNEQSMIHLPINYLNYLDTNVFDEFIVCEGKTKIIRRVGIDADGTKFALENEIIEEYEDLIISLSEGYNKIWLQSFYDANLTYSCKYVIKSDYTDTFATKVEMHNSITQSEDRINLEVSKKVDENEVIAAINLSSEEAAIKANKIKFEGLVTANKNFKILADGSIEAKNASLSGNVYLPAGGKVVGGDGMMSVMIVNGNLWGQQFAGASGFVPLGFETYVDQNSNFKTVANAMVLEFMIPNNFKPKKAFIYLRHIPTQNSYDSSGNKVTGYSKNIKAYINNGNFYRDIDWTMQKFTISGSYSEISNCFGSSGFTGASSGIKEATSIDITNLIQNTGTYSIKLQSSYNSDDSYADTGCVLAQLYIYGYTSENIS
nr:MAG TPA: tail protein [Caudoviricetes sp.]